MPRKRLDTDIFIQRSINKHGNKYSYEESEYTKANSKIRIICLIHGPFEQKASEHMSGAGCIKCAENQDSKLKRKNVQLFISQAKELHDNKYDYSNVIYKNNSTKIEITCKVHGSFFQTPDDHLNSKSGCPKCAKVISKLETEWLDYLNIPEIYRHHNMKINGKLIKTDAYDPKTNTIYEFYGDFWHGNPKIFDANDINGANHKTFNELYLNTLNREKLIISAGCNLQYIWENDWKIIKQNL